MCFGRAVDFDQSVGAGLGPQHAQPLARRTATRGQRTQGPLLLLGDDGFIDFKMLQFVYSPLARDERKAQSSGFGGSGCLHSTEDVALARNRSAI